MKIFENQDKRQSIYASIIASILVIIFIEPIIKFLWNIILKYSGTIYSGYLDSIYENAALGYKNYLEFIFFIFVSIGSLIFFITILSPFRHVFIKSVVDSDKLSKIKKLRTPTQKKIRVTIRVLLDLIFIILTWAFIIAATVDLQINTSFQQRLSILRPYFPEYDEIQLKSLWASMKNRNDYLMINSKIDSLAQLKKIRLPEPLLR